MASTTCQDIIDAAMRNLGVIAANEVATGADAETALDALQDAIITLPLLMDGQWNDVFLTSNASYSATDGDRIFVQGHTPTITLPATYADECNVTKATLDCSRVQVVGSGHTQEGVWVYSASKGAWARVDNLEITDDSPFGQETGPGLAALIAVALASQYGAQLDDLTINRAQRCQAGFRARFYREVIVRVDEAFLRMSDLGNGDPSNWIAGN